MKRFSKFLMIFITSIALICAGLIGITQADDTEQDFSRLWEKAAAYLAVHHWVPGKLVEHEFTYNLKGKLEEEKRMVVGFTPDNLNRIQMSLHTAEENGKDISWQVRSALEDTVSLDELIGDSPFTPTRGQEVTSHFNGQRRQINGRSCLGFDFIYRTDDATVEGTAWLDRQHGLPAEIHSRIISVPYRQDETKISAFTESEYFTITDQGDCLLERSQAEMEVAVPKLWFKGQIKTLSVSENHWKYIAAQ